MAEKNIEININNGSSYDTLYPKTISNLIANSTNLISLLNLGSNSIIDEAFNNIKTKIDTINTNIIGVGKTFKGKISPNGDDFSAYVGFTPYLFIASFGAYDKGPGDIYMNGRTAIIINGIQYYVMLAQSGSHSFVSYSENDCTLSSTTIIPLFFQFRNSYQSFTCDYFAIS